MDDTLEPSIQELYNKSVVLKVGGKKIGVIGVIISTVNVRSYFKISFEKVLTF